MFSVNRFFIKLSICCLSVASFSLAYAEVNYQEQIKTYVRCEALQNVVASILSDSEEEFFQHELHHAANDSNVIAKHLTRIGDYREEVLDELYLIYLDEFQNDLLKRAENGEANLFMQDARPQLDRCEELNELQADIIQRSKEEDQS